MRIDKKYYNLSFDRFSRQSRVFDVIEALRNKGQSFKILDVGGYRGVTRELHKKDDITILDLYDVKEKGYIKANALNMPFDDSSFDFVVSFDVFEHIEDKDRLAFLSESNRVAKTAVITAAPILTEANEKAEEYLNSIHIKLYGKEHEWLDEHIRYGLPRPNQAKNILENLGLVTETFGSNETVFWTLLQGAIFLNAKFKEGQESLTQLNALYNQLAYNDGAENPLECYRQVVCGFKSDKSAKIAKQYLNSHSSYLRHAEKVEIAKILNNHYLSTLSSYTSLYESLYEDFVKKVKEKDLLLKTIKNITGELEDLKQQNKLAENQLQAIKSTKTYKLAHRVSILKRRSAK